ncbi:MAG TPA: hypothetical protein VN922_13585 [Bacteroidia bacterium]|nr:hypothetical protein [Bacteroidia bacterium]
MNKKRLIKAYSILKTIPQGNLDLRTWKAPGYSIKPTCNTIACAAGWLSMHPDFAGEGLISATNGTPFYETPTGKFKYFGYDAMAKFLGISEKDSERLFQPNLNRDNRNDKRTVLRRFQRFFAEQGIVV